MIVTVGRDCSFGVLGLLIALVGWWFAVPMIGAVEIVDTQLEPLRFEFVSMEGAFHVVESSADLEHWVIVAEFEGDGESVLYTEGREALGPRQYYRVRSQTTPFEDALFDREWRLVSITDEDDVIEPLAGRTHTMRLSRAGGLGGRNDCNTMFGDYSLKGGNRLRIPGIGSTMIACAPGSIDRVFIQELTRDVGVFEVDDEHLTIYVGNDPVVRFDFKATEGD